MAPARVIRAVAPIRVCDVGGWTDTWFARTGAVCSVAVSPGSTVTARVTERRDDHVIVAAEAFGDRYPLSNAAAPRHPLLEAAIRTVGVPDDVSVELDVRAAAPPGCSTGTSASVVVSLIGALDAVAGRVRDRDETARLAHSVEVDVLGLQSGVQDQYAAAHGGVNLIEVGEYPRAMVRPLAVPEATRRELESSLVVVYLGRAHVSSEVHEEVIAALGRDGARTRALDALRGLARDAADALVAGDLEAYARILRRSTDAQAALHSTLVSADAARVIAAARQAGALGWKVNGAGGDGGSVTVLARPGTAPDVARAVEGLSARYRVLPVSLDDRGLQVHSANGEPS